MIVIDSVGWIEFFSGGLRADRYEDYLEDLSAILTPSIILYEVYKKIKRDRSEGDALMAAAQIGKTQVVPLDEALCVSAADISLEFALPLADSIVYATALANGATVVTSDDHFKGLPEVEFIE